MTRPDLPATGDVLADRYEVERILGEGAAATVLQCLDLPLGRRVAVKLLKSGADLGDPDRFLDEARTLASLVHPHIVTLYGSGRHGRHLFLALEFMAGGSLLQRIGRDGMADADSIRFGLETLAALEAAHDAGILHRDVKPENVLLSADGTAKLADFGLAKGGNSTVRTRTGIVMGTPEFMAPELLQGHPASAASDLYAWGCLLYTLVNGMPPHSEGLPSGSFAEIAKLRMAGVAPSGREQGPLKAALNAALVADPRRRPDAGKLRQLLEGRNPAVSRARTVLARQVDATDSLDPATRATPSPRSWARPAALAATLLGAAAWLALPSRSPAPPAASPAPARPAAPGPAQGDQHDRALLERWSLARNEFADGAVIRDLHAQVGAGDSGYTKQMLRRRRGEPTDPALDLNALARAAPSLPYRDDLEVDREALRRFLGDEEVSISDRYAIFEVIQSLAHVDTYYRAWGLAPPYRVREVLEALVRWRFVPYDADAFSMPAATPGQAPGPGRHLLYEWKDTWDRMFP